MKQIVCLVLSLSLCLSIQLVPVFAENECQHEWGPWETDWNETCGEDGRRSRYCNLCQEYETKRIPATGNHQWEDDWYIDDEPTCFQNGSKYRYCAVCNEMQRAKVPAYGSHDWTPWKVMEKPTCAYSGTAERRCNRCDAEQARSVAKLTTHAVGNWTVIYDPTALSSGLAVRSCECGKISHEKVLPKLKASVTLNKTKVKIKRKKTVKLWIKKRTFGDKIKTWTTSNKRVATVKNGRVKGKKKGTAKITLIMKSGARAVCIVRVK